MIICCLLHCFSCHGRHQNQSNEIQQCSRVGKTEPVTYCSQYFHVFSGLDEGLVYCGIRRDAYSTGWTCTDIKITINNLYLDIFICNNVDVRRKKKSKLETVQIQYVWPVGLKYTVQFCKSEEGCWKCIEIWEFIPSSLSESCYNMDASSMASIHLKSRGKKNGTYKIFWHFKKNKYFKNIKPEEDCIFHPSSNEEL